MKKLLTMLVVALLAGTALVPDVDAKGERFPFALVVRFAHPTTTDQVLDVVDDKKLETDVVSIMAERNIFLVTTDGEIEVKGDGQVKLHGDAKKLFQRIEKRDDVVWASPTIGPPADDAGFHAWGFHAWGFHAWGFHAWPDSQFVPVEAATRFVQPAFEPYDLDALHVHARGAGVRVAVLDTGVDLTHPQYAHQLLPGLDLIDFDMDPSEETNGVDDDGDGYIDEAWGHGTFVAGVVSQLAPDAEILPIRVLDADGRASQWAVIEAVEYAIEQDVDVINMSFGLPDKQKSKELSEVLKRAAKEHDIVIVAAAGNQSLEDKNFPAGEKDVLGVGALDGQGAELAHFSNFGKWVELAAPGADIISSVPGGGYARWGGTSVATPVVAGLAAVAFEASPYADAKDIMKALRDGARKMRGHRRAEEGMLDVVEAFDRLGLELDLSRGSSTTETGTGTATGTAATTGETSRTASGD